MQKNEMLDSPSEWAELWGIVGESLLSGVHHALNNRVAALGAISQVMRSGLPDGGPLVSSLATEVQQLEETVALLSLLRRARTRRPEPVQLPELVRGLAPLLAQHNDLKEVEFVVAADPGVLPVWVERDQLTRVLLTLAVAVGVDAERGRCRSVCFSFRGDEAAVTARIDCESFAPHPGATGRGELAARNLDARAATRAVEPMGGVLEAQVLPGGETAYEIRLPTLLAARRADGME